MKNIAVFNDLSGYGRCSLTAAIPVLSVLGCCCHPIATAVLTGQSGYEHYYCKDLTEMLPEYEKNWKKNKVTLDAIYSGYMTSPRQFDAVNSFITNFRSNNSYLLVDPIMGDHGKPFSIFSEELLKNMRSLCKQADIITPNLTEACLLLGISPDQILTISNLDLLLNKVSDLALKLQERSENCSDIVITGILPYRQLSPYIYTVAASKNQISIHHFDFYNKSYSGTGDLFASTLCGLKLKGLSLNAGIQIAGTFLSHSIADTIKENTAGTDGVHFESHLRELFELSVSTKQ